MKEVYFICPKDIDDKDLKVSDLFDRDMMTSGPFDDLLKAMSMRATLDRQLQRKHKIIELKVLIKAVYPALL